MLAMRSTVVDGVVDSTIQENGSVDGTRVVDTLSGERESVDNQTLNFEL